MHAKVSIVQDYLEWKILLKWERTLEKRNICKMEIIYWWISNDYY